MEKSGDAAPIREGPPRSAGATMRLATIDSSVMAKTQRIARLMKPPLSPPCR